MENKIKERIKEVEELIKTIPISLATSEYYLNLIQIYHELWNLLYFKKHQEKNYLRKK